MAYSTKEEESNKMRELLQDQERKLKSMKQG